MTRFQENHCAEDRALLELEASFCSYGDTVHYASHPKLFTACDRGYLYDEEGTPYCDLQMQYSAANFGYRNLHLIGALENQLDKLSQLGSEQLHEQTVRLAEKIATLTEKRFGLKGQVYFDVGGAAAVEDSLRLVRQATGKNIHFAFMGGYHGRTLGASAITSSYRYRRRYGHFGDRAHFVPYPYCFRCFYERKPEDCGLYCVGQFEKLFDTEYYSFWDSKAGECEFGAFYMEPVQGTGGYVIPPKDYFAGLARTLSQRGILLVDDEIQMGFFRTGKLWAIEHFGVAPDIILFGKALTNGLNPLSGIWARNGLINPPGWPLDSPSPAPTANPQGTAVALEILRSLGDEGALGKTVQQKGDYFLAALKNLKRKYPGIIGDVGGLGLALRIEICRGNDRNPDPETTERLFSEGLKGDLQRGGRPYGLVLDVGGYYKNVLTLAPYLDITFEEIDLAAGLLDQIFERVCHPQG